MTRAEILAELLALGGVSGAAFVGGDGVLEPSAETPFPEMREAVNDCLASGQELAEMLGAEAPVQTVLEFGGGAALLTRLSAPSETLPPLNVVVLTTAAELGRVRFGLRRLSLHLTGDP